VKRTFALPAATDEDAVKVNVAAAEPDVICAVCGEMEMPDGSPEGTTVIEPEKPLLPAALTLTVPVPGKRSVRVDTESAMLKSGGGAASTVRASEAVWLREPDVPVKRTFVLPAAADEDEVKVKTAGAEPAVICAVCGEMEIPEGIPEGTTVMAPENPLLPVALALTAPMPEDARVRVETESEPPPFPALPPLPQPK